MIDMLKVGANTDPCKLAGAIAGVLAESESVKVRCAGKDALSSAVKGIIYSKRLIGRAPSVRMEYDSMENGNVVIEMHVS